MLCKVLFHFNLVNDEIISKNINITKAYKYIMTLKYFKAICSISTMLYLLQSQRKLYRECVRFLKNCHWCQDENKYWWNKVHCTSKEVTRCKLEINRKIIEQTMKLNHLVAEITSNSNLSNERGQKNNEQNMNNRIFKSIVFRNECLGS